MGGLGFFETTSGDFEILSPPEISDWSVSAIEIEGATAWVAIHHRGEWGDMAGGLLHIDTGTGLVDSYPVPFVVNHIVRFADRLYMTSHEGISILLPRGQLEHHFIDSSADASYRLTRSNTIY